MKKDHEKDIDRLYRKGLSNPEDHIAYRDEDWDAMNDLLNEQKKRKGFIYRLPVILSGVAAMLLLALGFFFLRPQNEHKKGVVVKNKLNPDNGDSVKIKNPVDNAVIPGNITTTSSNQSVAANASKIKPTNFTGVINYKEISKSLNVNGNDSKTALHITDTLSKRQALATTDTAKNNSNTQQQVLAAINVPVDTKPADTTINTAVIPTQNKEKKGASVRTLGTSHPVVLSIIAAPDFNGVGSAFNRTMVGTNAGLMLSVGVTNKLTVSTGAVYSKKPYMIGFSEYNYVSDYKFSANPTDVTADCRVLDIPINIDYKIYNKGLNQFSIGTGISSYFMLSEKYNYNYQNGVAGPASYMVKNQNKHLFGVVNLNATYQRRISSKFGFNVQPYMKMPITDIGYGRVNLKSTGVAIGASWYLHTSSRKK
jgi:hypothetical protein